MPSVPDAVLNPEAAQAALVRLVQFYEGLSPATLARLAEVYHPDARFKDPFNDVTGVAAIGRIFGHMFRTLDAPRFQVLTQVLQGNQAFLTWDFHFRRRGSAQAMRIHGASHLKLATDGRVLLHRDYWDAAEELYAKLPLIGALMRWLQRRVAA